MGTKENLQEAFAGESQANRMYLAFAKKADEDGLPQVAKLFRAAAEAETVHAHAHLRVLGGIKTTAENLESRPFLKPPRKKATNLQSFHLKTPWRLKRSITDSTLRPLRLFCRTQICLKRRFTSVRYAEIPSKEVYPRSARSATFQAANL